MKYHSKSSRHKSENTFVFQTFHERIDKIKISSSRKDARFSALPQDADSFFGEALDKWTDLNCTQHFVAFRAEIAGEVRSLPQLIYHQKEIVEALKRNLLVTDSLALQPLLDLVAQLGRDLQADFYSQYFTEFFDVYKHLLSVRHHDVDALEQIFMSLAHLFKFLAKPMVQDIKNLYRLLSPLLRSDLYKEYINVFAADAFSFLMRKEKNVSELLDFIFSSLADNQNLISGVGCLLFEVLKGVQHQFHSCADKLISLLLDKLIESSADGSSGSDIFEVLCNTWHHMMQYSTVLHFSIVPSLMLAKLNSQHAVWKSVGSDSKSSSHGMAVVMRLLTLCIKYKNGALIGDRTTLVMTLLTLLEDATLPDNVVKELFTTVRVLLLSTQCELEAQHRPRILSAVFKMYHNPELIFNFTRGLHDLPLFEKDALPCLIDFCHEHIKLSLESKSGRTHDTDDRNEGMFGVLQALTSLIASKAPSSMENNYKITSYPLDFSSAARKWSVEQTLSDWMLQELNSQYKSLQISVASVDIPLLWSLLCCLRHVRPLEVEKASTLTKNLVEALIESLSQESQGPAGKELMWVLRETVVTYLHILAESDSILDVATLLQKFLHLLSKHPSDINCLEMTYMYLRWIKTIDGSIILTDQCFSDMFTHIQSNLSSPQAKIRALTLQICCLFDLKLPVISSEEKISAEQKGVFKICLDAETTPATMHCYRDKLMHLRCLDQKYITNQLPEGVSQQIVLRYLIGQLHISLELLWKPVIELIKSYADGIPLNEFWAVFGPLLEEAGQQAALELHDESPRRDEVLPSDDTENPLRRIYTQVTNAERVTLIQPKFSAFRSQLWTAMHGFPHVCEPRSRIIVPIFLKFLENEFYPQDPGEAPTQDLRSSAGVWEEGCEDDDAAENEADDTMIVDESDDDNLQNKQQASEQSVKGNKKIKKRLDKKGSNKASNSSLITHLKLFSMFRDPRSMYQEPKLLQLYLELLKHKAPSVQKVAFDCILTYKYSYLMPYKENFYRVLDDKTFKDEIVLFSIDSEQTTVKSEHREQLIPILMSILYGKMKLRFGKSSGGRMQGHARKIILLSFIAHSEPHEICVFLDLMFQSFLHLITDDVERQVESLLEGVDISRTIPLKKMQGVLNSMELVLSKLGHRIESCYLPRIIQVILCVAAMCASLLHKRSQLSPFTVNLLKRIRSVAQLRIIDIFTMFESYPFSAAEINALFSAIVWPQIEKLPTDAAVSPTPLFKLMCVWSCAPRLVCLLAKCHPLRKEICCLPFIFKLLESKQISTQVSGKIMELVESLLTDNEDEDDAEKDSVPALDVGPTCADITKPDIQVGLTLLLPYVPVILQHLTSCVEKFVNKTGVIKSIPTCELNILSILSEHIDDEAQSAKIISLLLPFLGKRTRRSQRTEVDILTAVQHLFTKISQPRLFIQKLATLFSCLTARPSRTGLCNTLEAASKRDSSLEIIATLTTKLNAWDRRHIEEPDYTLRLEGFSEATKILQGWTAQGLESQSTVDVDLLVMLTHNCTYLISSTEDLALRSNAVECLYRLIVTVQSSQPEIFQRVIVNHLLPEIKQGLKHKNEVSRHGFIALLEYLVKHFPKHSLFCDLVQLRDDADVERDFFQNISHVQMHRRSRALRRLAGFILSVRVKNDTLTSFLLPIVGSFLRDESYMKQTDLLDACIEATAAISQCLPWHYYQLLLLHHLGSMSKQLTNQKLAVRIVVAILDSFHFDLKNSLLSTNSNSSNDKTVESLEDTEAEKSANQEESEEVKLSQDKDEEVSVTMETDVSVTMETYQMDDGLTDEDTGPVAEVHNTPGRIVECPPGLATRIHKSIITQLMPQLHRVLTEKAKSDDQHKLAQAGRYAEDEEILRVPIALAMVKLLQTLPTKSLHQNLPSILLKVCQFLCSRAKDIRDTSRSTLMKILRSLGPSYFRYILSEMRSVLKRGYQLHVLCYTVWMLLEDIKSTLKPGDLDSCIGQLTEILNEELFGVVSEEKEVDGILSKVFEARTTKSLISYGLLASVVSSDSFVKLILPLKQVLATTRSRKQSKTVSEVLLKIVDGFVSNSALNLEQLMVFVYGLTSDSMAQIVNKAQQQDEEASKVKSDPRLAPPSTFLLKAEPARAGNRKPKAHAMANMYILVDFGLQLLYKLLKRSVLVSSNKEHLKLLNPFIAVISNCLSCKHVRVTASALRCLTWLLRFPLSTLKKHIKIISNHMFVILKNYAVAGAGKGDNFELVVMCFKAVTVLVRDVTYHKISQQQLQVLLGFAEQDLNDYTRRATAFSILKAILSRKLIVDEMTGIIQQVEQLSVTSDAPEIRQQCRQVVLQYLLDYPLDGSKMRKHLEFFIEQREYEYESGRKGVLEMLAAIFHSFPQEVVAEHSGLFFVPLAERLVNEESTSCKELTALAIKTLITKLNHEQRDHLFSCCITWMKSYKTTLRMLSAMAVGLFVEVETSSFERHLGTLLPLIKAQVSFEKYEQPCVSENEQRSVDHVLFLYLDLLLKIFKNCQIIRKSQWRSMLNGIWGDVQVFLLYDHDWVRLASAQLFGMMFSCYKPEDLISDSPVVNQVSDVVKSGKKKKKLASGELEEEYLRMDVHEKLHTLCGTMTNQLSAANLSQDLADQIIKNLVYLAKVVKLVKATSCDEIKAESEDFDNVDKEETVSKSKHAGGVSIHWLVKRMCREVKQELNSNTKSTIKRSSVFKWFAAVSLDLASTHQLADHLPSIIRPLVRQITDSSSNSDAGLKTLAQEVLEIIKKTVGFELFNQEYSTAIRLVTSSREMRKNQRTLEAVTDPEAAARKKLKKNLAKKEAKKRKLNQLRPTKNTKKSKMEHLAKAEAF